MSSKSSDGGTPANRSSASTADLERRGALEEAPAGAGGRQDGKAAATAAKHGKAKDTKPADAADGGAELADRAGARGDGSLLDLQKESLKIEDSIMVANRVVQFQRGEAQVAIAEANEAKRLAERELLERENLHDTNKHAALDRVKRKEIKSFLMDVVNLLKDKQMEAKHLREAQEVAVALRLSLQQKRTAFQLLQKNVEDRERIERMQLQEGHDRSSKNLVVWQELELRQLAVDVREGARRINKIRAQQLKEVQQKEAEQLRELQHLKAKFSVGQFDMELEFMESYERQKAEQLVQVQQLDRRHKREKQELKKKIAEMREEMRAGNEVELNKQRAEQLLRTQEYRARQLLDSQKDKAIEREKGFEAETRAREAELTMLMEQADQTNSNTSGASKDSGSESSKTESSAVASSVATEDAGEAQRNEAAQAREDNMKTQDDDDNVRRNDRHNLQADVYLKQAQESLREQKQQQQRERTSAMQEHARLNKNTSDEFENRKAVYRQANETRTMELIKTHNREKGDIMAAHEREFEALKRSIELEKELHSKTLSETQVASQAKSEFLSFVCHELRNPLSGIVAIVDMLLKAKMNDDLKNHIDTIKHESELMCAIVNDVLDFAKIEANMLVLDPVRMELHKTVEDMVAEQQLIAHKTKPDVEILCSIARDVPKFVVTDPIRLRQVLLNLISNAIKFTFHGSIRIVVSVESQKGKDFGIKFEVIDTGVGIGPKDQEHIFSAFSQANPSTTREFGGTGLGLSISKALVERLGGTISVESTKGEGTRFFFTITGTDCRDEIESEKELDAPRTPKAAEIPKGLRVLVVEDSSTLRRLWAKLLKEQGCVVETATNGMDGIERCKKVLDEGHEMYDIVLMDITMPIMSGDEAVKKLREMNWTGVVIALTANAMESDRNYYLDAGMDAVVTKPFQMAQLRSVINEQLGKRKARMGAA